MTEHEFTITGYEVASRTVKPHGNGARVGIPRDWIGEEVAVVRRTKQDESTTVSPVAAILYDAVISGDSLEAGMERVVRFQSFEDIDQSVAVDFQECLTEFQSMRAGLQEKSRVDQIQTVHKKFYSELANTKSIDELKQTLENWI